MEAIRGRFKLRAKLVDDDSENVDYGELTVIMAAEDIHDPHMKGMIGY